MANKYDKFIAPSERVIHVFGYSNTQFIFDMIVGVILIPVLLYGLLIIAKAIYRKMTLMYIVTDKRVILKKGLIGQSTVSADYSKVTDVSVEQGVLGRLVLHTGTIVLDTAGTDDSEVILEWVPNPFEAKNIIYQQLHKTPRHEPPRDIPIG